jgi:uncharacterized membrane protein
MKIWKNKKGDESGGDVGGEFMASIIHAFIFALVIIALLFIISLNISEKTRIPQGIEQEIITKRFTDECFSQGDIRTIDFNEFNDNKLNYCYTGTSQSYRLTLTIQDSINEPSVSINTTNWDGYADKFFTEKILVLKDDKIYQGDLKIEIQS